MDTLDAIYQRRSVRAYRAKHVDRDVVDKLLDAAVQAPSAMNAQPWAFAVIQDRELLDDLSTRAKAHLLGTYDQDARLSRYRDVLSDPEFDIFYGAGLLIIVCAGTEGLVPAEDCCLAGENLMLAAVALGLGTCCIGWARPLLNLPEVKDELGIDTDLSPILPVIVGYPTGETSLVPRNAPRIVSWK